MRLFAKMRVSNSFGSFSTGIVDKRLSAKGVQQII